MITYYKSQKDVAAALKTLIDEYWSGQLDEILFFRELANIIQGNGDKMYKDKDFAPVIRQRLGKRRIELIEKILREDTK